MRKECSSVVWARSLRRAARKTIDMESWVFRFSSFRRHQQLKLPDKKWNILVLYFIFTEDNKTSSKAARNEIVSPSIQLLKKDNITSAPIDHSNTWSYYARNGILQLLYKKTRLEAKRQELECSELHFRSYRRRLLKLQEKSALFTPLLHLINGREQIWS